VSAKREIELGCASERLRACGAFAGGTPAVPANHLTLKPAPDSSLVN